MSRHADPHPLAGQTVTLDDGLALGMNGQRLAGATFEVEDYWDRVAGGSWMHAEGNPVCLEYAMRSGFAGLPTDDEVLYGKVEGRGHLVHVSEVRQPADDAGSRPCTRCDGCGQVATSEDQEPWTAWESLPPGSDLAVRVGLVQPIACPVCHGAKRVPA